MNLSYIVTNPHYENVKQVLKEEFHISERLLLKLKREEKIYLNDTLVFINHIVQLKDCITVFLDTEEISNTIVPTAMDLNILYEDESLLIIDKPSGMAVHPSHLHYDSSLSNGVRYYFEQIGLKKKIRPVNRLDKDTSGIVIFAKNEYVQESLRRQMITNQFKKYYLTLIEGQLDKKEDTITAPIARKENSIIERCVKSDGDTAITKYKVKQEFNDFSLLEISLLTGRTHQIRVHMSYLGHPILGDTLYGNPSSLIHRQALHAYIVECIHPITKTKLKIQAPIPEDIKNLIL